MIQRQKCTNISPTDIFWNRKNCLLTLISTWLKVFPLWTPTMLPIMSGRMIMFRKCVFTTAGFSNGAASFLAFLNFVIKAKGLCFNPRRNRLLALACTKSMSCSLDKSRSWSRSTPRNENFLKVLFFLISASAAAS